MASHWAELFKTHDDPVHGEQPPDFDRATAEAEFMKFAIQLSERLGRPVESETRTHIQDASFHGQISLGSGSLRFSNFGRMIAFTPDIELGGTELTAVEAVAADLDYTLVPTEELELAYTGQNAGVHGIRSWWIRFFDWL